MSLVDWRITGYQTRVSRRTAARNDRRINRPGDPQRHSVGKLDLDANRSRIPGVAGSPETDEAFKSYSSNPYWE
jgi:hypothetical protein